MSTSPRPSRDEPVSYRELAELQAGLLTAEQAEELKVRIDRDPSRTDTMREHLKAVDELFLGGGPADTAEPVDMPPEVAARLQATLAREAERRAYRLRGEPFHARESNEADHPGHGSS